MYGTKHKTTNDKREIGQFSHISKVAIMLATPKTVFTAKQSEK